MDKQEAEQRYAPSKEVGYIGCRSEYIRGIRVEFDFDLLTKSFDKLLAVVAED